MALQDVLAALVEQPQVMPVVPPPAPAGGMGFPLPPTFGMGFTQVAGEYRPRGRSDIPTAVPRMREGGFSGGGSGKVQVFDPWTRGTSYVRPEAPVAQNTRAVIGSNSGITRTTTGGNLTSGNKYGIPLEQMSATVRPSGPMLSRPVTTPESLYRQGSLIMPLVGDRTATGVTLTDIGGNPLSSEVSLYGGPGYMQGPGQQLDQSIWASGQGIITDIGNRALEAAKKGPVDLVYTAMGGTSGDFSTMMSDALVAQLPGAPISQKVAKDFDADMGGQIEGWPGVKSPKLASFLRGNPAARKAFADTVGKAPYQEQGFPNIAQTRYAITEPELVHAPTGVTGFSLGRFDADNPWVTNPSHFHPTYPASLRGTNSGQLDMAYPRELIWPDWFKMARQNPKLDFKGNPAGVDYAFGKQMPAQKADQQWLDQIKQYQELQKIRGY